MTNQRAREILTGKVDTFIQAFGQENIAQSDEERIVRKFMDYVCDETPEDDDGGPASYNTRALAAMGR